MSTLTLTSKSAAYINGRNILEDHRKVFESITDALDSLKKIYATENFPANFATVAAGVGLVDLRSADAIPPVDQWPDAYRTPGVLICVSFIGVRGLKEGDKEVNGARGFAVYPLFPIDMIRADESGEKWLWKVTEKEASHVALRGLRGIALALGNDAVAAAAMTMPVSVSDYVEEAEKDKMDSTAFDTLWRDFRKMLSESASTAALVPQLPGKAEVVKAIRSTAYAKEQYETLESIGAFVFIADTMAGMVDAMKAAAVAEGLPELEIDAGEIRTWLATRDTKIFDSPRKVVTDLNTLDFAAFAKTVVGGVKAAAENVAGENTTTEGQTA